MEQRFQRTLNGVSTRKLILASLICGVLIVVAGTVKLLQTANDTGRTIGLFQLGTNVEVAGVDVAVLEVQVNDTNTLVEVAMRGSEMTSPVAGWSMLANGEITTPLETTVCPAADANQQVSCTLEFVVAVGTPTLIYARDDEKAQWLGE